MDKILDGIEACIFDMDGTIIDSMGIWRAIDIEYFKKYQKELPEDYQERIEGLSVIETAEFTKETYGFPCSIETMIDEWNEMALEQYANHIHFKPNVELLLQILTSKGIKIGIATSNSSLLYNVFAKNSGLDKYVSKAITGEDVENGKPDPESYLKVAAGLNVNPKKCLVFEDITFGLQAAISAGMRTCAVDDTYSRYQWDEKVAMSDYNITEYKQLTDILK